MYNCPHCGRPGISIIRKLFLGPGIPAKCRVCGRKVNVPRTSMIAVIPFVIGTSTARFVEAMAAKVLLWIAGFLVMIIIVELFFPLERAE